MDNIKSKIYTNVISLGAGVQSSTLALMAEHGEITPTPDFAVFADTQEEPQSVYNWLDYLESKLSFPIYRVTKGKLGEDALKLRKSSRSGKIYQKLSLPMFTLDSNGKKGMIRRQCTRDYKITPVISTIRKKAGIKWGEKEIKVHNWMGISIDEAIRMRESRTIYIQNRYPLIELKMSRNDCLNWMSINGYPRPPRSACTFCPYHSDNEWQRLKNEEPDDFLKAVEFENKCHELSNFNEALEGVPYLHRSRIPLNQVIFNIKNNEVNNFGNECEGMCGV